MASSPLTLVIGGATGDLTARKLVPSLFRLERKMRLPAELRIVGMARTSLSDEAFRERMAKAIQEHAKADWDAKTWETFAPRLAYVADDAAKAGSLGPLRSWLEKEEAGRPARRLYYLAVAPDLYPDIVNNFGAAGLSQESNADAWRRLIIEKPFGHDLASAKALNATVRNHFRESQIYRIDHYLGKETVQNILVFRFANTLFEPVWNHNYIDHVQITVAEKVTVEGRGDYYDRAGVLRDMFQNHLLQLLTLVAMEAPGKFAADPLRNEKLKVLDAIPVYTAAQAAENLVCGQYAGYRHEKGVPADSRTPTFAVAQFGIDNWRWRGVPFYLRSGKALKQRFSEIVVQFRCPPHLMFPMPPGATLQCNRLSICVQPDEGIHLSFQSKVPDEDTMVLRPAEMEFHYGSTYKDRPIPESYERLLMDAIHGDAALFMRSDEIERAWELIDPLVAAAAPGVGPCPGDYAIGSDGPACADEFLARTGKEWSSICHD